MSFDIGSALEDGVERTTATNGLQFVALFTLIGVASTILAVDFAGTLIQQAVEEGSLEPEFSGNPMLGEDPTEPIVGLPLALSALGLVVTALVQVVVTVAAVRTFASDETATIPAEYFTRRILWLALNLVIGGIVFGLLVAVGFVFLIVPGIFLLVSLFFWWVIVVVEDRSFVDAFGVSWRLTKGNRLELFFLGLIVSFVVNVGNWLGSMIGGVGPQIVAITLTAVFTAPLGVFNVATAASAYRQLRGGESIPGAAETPPGADGTAPGTGERADTTRDTDW